MPQLKNAVSPFVPQLIAKPKFVLDSHGSVSVVFIFDDSYEIRFLRCNNRWRIARGYYTSSHRIASQIFQYSERPNDDEINIMYTFVETLAKFVDACEEKFIKFVNERVIERQNIKNGIFPIGYDVLGEQERKSIDNSYYVSKVPNIYLMSHTNGLTKIGKSIDPKARERTLQAEDPRLEMIFYHPSWDGLERKLHSIFADLRIRGEWFKLEDRHIDWIMFFVKAINPQHEIVGA